MVDIAEADAARREAMERREREYQRQEARARQQAAPPAAPPVLSWDEQGEEIRRMNSRALAVVSSIIDGTADHLLDPAAHLTEDSEIRKRLWKLASFDEALGNLARCATIARTWAARSDPAGGGDPKKLSDRELEEAGS